MTTDGNWFELISTNGLALAIVVLMMWMAIKYAPLLIRTHLDFVDSAKKQGERIVALHADQSGHNEEHLSETKRTNRALLRACDLLDYFAEVSGQRDDIHMHVAEIRKALSREEP